MKALTLVLVVALAGCASQQTGIMWGYAAQSQKLSEVQGIIYTSDRGHCEKVLREGRTLPNPLRFQLPGACQQFAVIDFGESGPTDNRDRVYWSTWLGDGAAAYNMSEWCADAKATWRGGACKAVVITPLR
jgi:hypothetical protein